MSLIVLNERIVTKLVIVNQFKNMKMSLASFSPVPEL